MIRKVIDILQSGFTLATALLAFSIPFLERKWIPPAIALWGFVAWFSWKRSNLKTNPRPLLWLLAFYLVYVFWMVGSQNVDDGKFLLEVKMTFALFPIWWLLSPTLSYKQRTNVLLGFSWGCLAIVLFTLGRSSIDFISNGDARAFYYSKLAWYFHPTYLATYCAFGLIVLGYLSGRNMYLLKRKLFHHLVEFFLLLEIGLLSSKAGYLCAFFAMFLIAIFRIKKRSLKFGISYLLIGISVLTLIVATSPSSQKRILEMVGDKRPKIEQVESTLENSLDEDTSKGSTAGRIASWKAAMQILVENPFGVGTGDELDALLEKYEENQNTYALEKRMNAHNQYLQVLLTAGIPGLLIFLGMFIDSFLLSLKRKDPIHQGFLGLLFLNMLFESFLEVQAGVIFFAFFYCFFIRSMPKQK